MREQRSTGSISAAWSSHAPSSLTTLKRWMRRRLFRTIHIGIFLSGLTAIGIHCHFVAAQQGKDASETATLASPRTSSQAQTSAPSSSAPTDKTAPAAPRVNAALTTAVQATTPPSSIKPAPNEQAPFEVTEVRREPIPFKKVIHLSENEGLGQTRIAKYGEPGVLEKTFRVTYHGATAIQFEMIGSKVVQQPVNTEVIAGYTDRMARALPSRSRMYTRTREVDLIATGYSPMEGSRSGRCADGMRAGYGVVAVDPRLIPLGSRLYIEGYGYAVAGDTGGAIRGHRIDLGLNSRHAAAMIGRRRVHVFVLADDER